ncbi:hypothetical protein BT93_E1638 [Corymbia citriodora subsp. variegata]|nr:hypothetical protein BT93_E1638 [Corymbia citriodora subsp. variegata]
MVIFANYESSAERDDVKEPFSEHYSEHNHFDKGKRHD